MKKIISIIIVLSLVLGACSFGKKPERKSAEFGETISSGKHFLFITESKSKNIKASDKIKKIAYVNNAKIKYYNLNESSVKLKDITDKDNEELLKLAKKEDKNRFKTDKAQAIEQNKINFVTLEKDDPEYRKAERTEKNLENLSYIKPKSHKLKLETTIENGKPSMELLTAQYTPSIMFNYTQDKYSKDKNEWHDDIYNQEVAAKEINDKRYSGLQNKIQIDDKDELYNKVLIKLNDKQSKIKFDKPNKNNDVISTFNYDDIRKSDFKT